MGACLSCLRPEVDEDEYNERTSLLAGNNGFSNDNLHEELLKQQQRQSELNGIVNELSDNLIDVSTFLSSNTTMNQSVANVEESDDTTENVLEDDVLSNKKAKEQLLKEVEELDDATKESCKVELTGPLFLEFN